MNREAREAETAQAMEIGGISRTAISTSRRENFRAFLRSPSMRVNEKDQDFAIYRQVQIQADSERRTLYVPVVSIECKTYIDKTMLWRGPSPPPRKSKWATRTAFSLWLPSGMMSVTRWTQVFAHRPDIRPAASEASCGEQPHPVSGGAGSVQAGAGSISRGIGHGLRRR